MGAGVRDGRANLDRMTRPKSAHRSSSAASAEGSGKSTDPPPPSHPGPRRTGKESPGVEDFLGILLRGAGGVLLLSGNDPDARVRTIERLAEAAGGEGRLVLSVTCQDNDREVPFAPWAELVREFVRSSPRSLVFRATRDHWAILQRLVPELSELVWLHDPAVPESKVTDRRELPRALPGFFTALATFRPTLLLMDSLASADPGSLELIEGVGSAAHPSGLGLVGGFGESDLDENDALHHLTLRLGPQSWVTRVRLSPLPGSGPNAPGRTLAGQPGPGTPEHEPIGIAVLPFSNISPDPSDAYFSDGLTEEVISSLSASEDLRVIARTSVVPYKETTKGISQIGAELRVSHVLEGSVRKVGDRLRVTVQLIEVRTESHLWAKSYERRMDDIFAVQSDLAQHVLNALSDSLNLPRSAPALPKPPVRPDSYLAYLKGRTLHSEYTRASFQAAKEAFERAIELDPQNAAAHAGLADMVRILGEFSYSDLPRGDWDRKSRQLARRAIELDPNLAEAHASLALMLLSDYDYAAAEKELQTALALNPSYSWAHGSYGCLLEDQGRSEEALVEFTLAEAADPLGPFNLLVLGFLLVWLGRLDEAFARIQKLGELEPSAPWYHYVLAHYFLARRDLDRCRSEFERWEELEPDLRRKPVIRAHGLALTGGKKEARRLLEREATLPPYEVTMWLIGVGHAYLGNLDQCFGWLERAVEAHLVPFQSVRLDPRLESVRRDPRFSQLLKKMNLT
jgi:TolB-like protein/Flp pilus assembly protein TadD